MLLQTNNRGSDAHKKDAAMIIIWTFFGTSAWCLTVETVVNNRKWQHAPSVVLIIKIYHTYYRPGIYSILLHGNIHKRHTSPIFSYQDEKRPGVDFRILVPPALPNTVFIAFYMCSAPPDPTNKLDKGLKYPDRFLYVLVINLGTGSEFLQMYKVATT